MSETQDANDLAETLVILDHQARDSGHLPEACRKWTEAPAFANGKSLGFNVICEGERCSLSGIEVTAEGDFRVIMAVAEREEDDPEKFHITVQELENAFPKAFKLLDELSWGTTDESLGLNAHTTRVRLKGKPALTDVVKTYLKEGRRSYLEGRAEVEEIEATAFYEAKDDFGLF